MFISFDGGRSWIYNFDTSQGAHRRYFFSLMVGAPKSTTPAPSKEPTVDVS
jgi:hypothetical protein